MSKTKIIAMYLPQYHCIPENDLFWGKGFTDWTTVQKAKPLFKGHHQPRVPLSGVYYDLSEEQNVVWQSQLAEEYGIYGFGVYHYWFNNEKNLLTKPAEIIRDSKDVHINYFLAWDNANWKRSWSNVEGNDWSPLLEKKVNSSKKEPAILIPYILGEEKDWEIHYKSVLTHFLSPKYIKIDNKPVFIIFNYSTDIQKMCDYWNELSKADGFDGIFFITRHSKAYTVPNNVYTFKYEPVYSGWTRVPFFVKIENKIRNLLKLPSPGRHCNYDNVWKKIIDNARQDTDQNIFHGGFVQYDDTPRRGKRGTIVSGGSPDKFGSYIKELAKITEDQNKDFIFLTAWNEWGEGAYLEPDSENKYLYLQSLKSNLKTQ